MALYLGNSKKLKININNVVYRFNFFLSLLISGIRLLSSEDYVLKSSDGLYLTAKEDE